MQNASFILSSATDVKNKTLLRLVLFNSKHICLYENYTVWLCYFNNISDFTHAPWTSR